MTIERWHKWTGGITGTLVLIGMVWGILNFLYVPRSEGAEIKTQQRQDKASILRRWIAETEEKIQVKHDEMIEIEHDRADLSERAKDELISVRKRQIAKLEAALACYRTGRLDC